MSKSTCAYRGCRKKTETKYCSEGCRKRELRALRDDITALVGANKTCKGCETDLLTPATLCGFCLADADEVAA